MRENKKKKILIVSGICLFLVFYIIFLKPRNFNQKIDDFSYNVFSSLKQFVLDNPINWIKKSFDIIVNNNQLLEENKLLRQNMIAINSYQTALEYKDQEIKKLQQQLNLKSSLSNYKNISAQIIQRQARYFSQRVKINVGSDDGVKVNNAVINGQGIVGIVDSVEKDYSYVSLLTNTQSPIQLSVKIMTKNKQQVDAILDYYDSAKQSYKITLLENNQSIEKDDAIVTSGLSHLVPSGLLIGKIEEVVKNETSLSLVLYAKSSVDFNQLDYVMVILQ